MAETIGITMIGASGTGKTCYLYAMYANMAFGVNGFTFTPTDYDQSLALDAGWEGIADEGRWPTGTDGSVDYKFRCSYALRPLMTFTWHDYRGGILTDSETPSERVMLFQNINHSFALIMCIAADVALGASSNNQKMRKILVKYVQLLAQYVDENHGKQIPIILAITKADLLGPGDLKQIVDYLRKEAFQSIFKKDGGWLLMITMVSLGDLGKQGGAGTPVSGTIDPVNVHLPVLFPIQQYLSSVKINCEAKRRGKMEELHDRRRALEREQKKTGWQSFWQGNSSGAIASDISDLEKQLNNLGGHINNLERDLNKILSELQRLDKNNEPISYTFYSGERVVPNL